MILSTKPNKPTAMQKTHEIGSKPHHTVFIPGPAKVKKIIYKKKIPPTMTMKY